MNIKIGCPVKVIFHKRLIFLKFYEVTLSLKARKTTTIGKVVEFLKTYFNANNKIVKIRYDDSWKSEQETLENLGVGDGDTLEAEFWYHSISG